MSGHKATAQHAVPRTDPDYTQIEGWPTKKYMSPLVACLHMSPSFAFSAHRAQRSSGHPCGLRSGTPSRGSRLTARI
eukprot:550016-Pyramimonas_sp.AAC.1